MPRMPTPKPPTIPYQETIYGNPQIQPGYPQAPTPTIAVQDATIVEFIGVRVFEDGSFAYVFRDGRGGEILQPYPRDLAPRLVLETARAFGLSMSGGKTTTEGLREACDFLRIEVLNPIEIQLDLGISPITGVIK